MLIVALPVWFVMGFADVYRKCKKMWLLDTYACTVTKNPAGMVAFGGKLYILLL